MFCCKSFKEERYAIIFGVIYKAAEMMEASQRAVFNVVPYQYATFYSATTIPNQHPCRFAKNVVLYGVDSNPHENHLHMFVVVG